MSNNEVLLKNHSISAAGYTLIKMIFGQAGAKK